MFRLTPIRLAFIGVFTFIVAVSAAPADVRIPGKVEAGLPRLRWRSRISSTPSARQSPSNR